MPSSCCASRSDNSPTIVCARHLLPGARFTARPSYPRDGLAPYCVSSGNWQFEANVAMGLKLLSGPVSEPVSIDEVKAHLRVDGTSEDALIASLLLTSRLHIETALGLALMTQQWQLVMDTWTAGAIVKLGIAPVQSIIEIRTFDADGIATVVPATSYVLEATGRPARIVAKDQGWPMPGRKAGGIQIDFVAGFGGVANAVPSPIRQALLLLVTHWYEHRDPIEIGAPATAVPQAVSHLLHPYRPVRV